MTSRLLAATHGATMSALVRAVALVLFWSSGFIGAELGTEASPPATLLTWRFLLTAVVLLPWWLPALRHLDRHEWGRQAVLALLSQCLYVAGVFWAAAAGVPAGTSALIASLQPALVLAAVVLLDGGRLRPAHLVGLVLGSSGVALTAAGDLRAGVSVLALVLPLSAMLALTAGTLLQQRWSTRSHRPTPLMQTLAVQSLVSAGFATAWTAATGDLVPPPTTGFWVATGWAVAAGIGSYGLYYSITTHDGAARASTLLYLTPAATALWAALMFGQPLRVTTVLGLLVSTAAVVVLTTAGPTSALPRCGDLREARAGAEGPALRTGAGGEGTVGRWSSPAGSHSAAVVHPLPDRWAQPGQPTRDTCDRHRRHSGRDRR